MSLTLILVIILIIFVFGALPRWNHSAEWGYGPSGLIGVIVVILIVLLLLGKLH